MKRWPIHTAYFWESAPFLRLLLPMIAGILLYSLWESNGTAILVATLIAYLVFAIAAIYRKRNTITSTVTFISLHVVLVFTSYSLSYFHDVQNKPLWFGHTINSADLYQVRIAETPQEKATTWKLQVKVLASILPTNTEPAIGKAFVYVYKDDQPLSVRKGDTLLIPNRWQAIKNAGNPFEFDYAAYCARNNIYHQQFLAAKDVHLYNKGKPQDLSLTETAHDWSMHTLEKYIPDSATLGLIQSMLIGDEINLGEDTRKTFTETGIVHIIAISGGNIAILFLLITFLLGWIKHRKYKWLKYFIALPVIWFYVLMAGASPSAIRAAVMFSILAIGFIIHDRSDGNSLNQLFATAFILLCAEPMWLYAIGFQLSFLAVLSLILFYKHIYRLYTPVNKIAQALWGTVAASIAAEILVAPLVIYYFHSFPLTFILSNVAAYILLGGLLVMGMGILAFSFLPALAKAIGTIVTSLVSVFNNIIEFLQKLEPATLHTLRLYAIELILVYLVITAVAVFVLQKKKAAIFVGLSTACLLLLSFCINRYHDLQQQRLVVYNVGKVPYIELNNGSFFIALTSDTIDAAKKDYAIKPAHIGWQVLHETRPVNNEVIPVGNNTALILRSPILQPEGRFTGVAYVIIAYRAKLQDISFINSVFKPRHIILSYTIPEKQLSDWKAICRQANIRLHTMQDGAFILGEL